MPDGIEVLNTTSPIDPADGQVRDSDHDGLSDDAERNYGTNPNNPDTDNDRLSDADELLYNENPKNPDTNGNGLIDGVDPTSRGERFTNKKWHF